MTGSHDLQPGDAHETTLDSAVVGAFQAAASGKILTANLTLARMLGSASPADLIAASTDFSERLCSDPELRLEFRRLLEVRGAVRDFEVPVEQKDGGTRWLSVNARAVRDGSGNVLRYEGSAADITVRRRAEEALRTSLERFQALVANSAEEIVVVDADLKPVYLSPSVAHASGYSLEERAKLDALATVHPDDREVAESCLREAIGKPEQPVPFQHRLLRADRSPRWVEGVITNLLEEPRIEGIVVNYHDITERKQAEEEHTLLAAELLQAQKMEAVGRLAGGVAHNFNNLLTAISGYVELALERLPADSDVRADVEEIKRATERAAVVARGLLAFSRRRISCRESLDLNEIVSEIGALLDQLIGENVELKTILAPGPKRVEGDRSQLEQVIVNLAMNARDAMPKGGTLTIETASLNLSKPLADFDDSPERGRYVALSLRDTGTGMDEETRAKIFEPFFTTKDADHGTGLGLSTVYAIIEEAGGCVLVESQPNEGTTFTIYLPEGDSPA
jgi:PAS domain S-box-containing protein